jgi:bacteriophage protein of unknown function (DUF646)
MRGGSKFRSALRNAVSKAAGGTVRVGILETQTYPAKDGKGDVSVAQVAYWNEYGTANIPARPFFRNTIAEKQDEWADNAASILQHTDGDVGKALALIGEGVKGDIVETIQNFREPENAPSTVKKKGFNKPLIDTGDLWRAIQSEVVE